MLPAFDPITYLAAGIRDGAADHDRQFGLTAAHGSTAWWRIAALAFSVSNMVSMSRISAPPSTSPFICSVYAISTSSKVTARYPGLFTSGERERVLFSGPMAPATKHGFEGSFSCIHQRHFVHNAPMPHSVHKPVLHIIIGLGNTGAAERIGFKWYPPRHQDILCGSLQ